MLIASIIAKNFFILLISFRVVSFVVTIL